MANWNDDRLDKRDEEVKAGFVRLEGQINAHRQETNERFAEMRSEMREGFDRLERQIIANRREMLGGVLAIVVALIGVLGAGLA